MNLIDSLKFVKSCYAKTDLVPNLTHFVIRQGRITSFNGEVAASCPIALDFDTAPHAGHFYQCVDACKEAVSLTLEKDKLRIKSGGFKALVKCLDYSEVPTIIPMGTEFSLGVDILPTVEKLIRIIEDDNPKPWANGMLMHGKSCYATNGRVLAEAFLGKLLPTLNIPKKALLELVRNGEEPEKLIISHDMIFFMLPGDKWIASKTLLTDWPFDTIKNILSAKPNYKELPAGFWEAIDSLYKFADKSGKVFFLGDVISTHAQMNEDGASFDCPGVLDRGIYDCRQLVAAKPMIDKADFEQYPSAPALFFGGNIRGAIIGMVTRE